jgi:hypothetical protein
MFLEKTSMVAGVLVSWIKYPKAAPAIIAITIKSVS